MDVCKIVVVDDSALFRTMMRNALTELPGCEVVGTAVEGATAVEKIVALTPDVVTLDIEMPLMDGMAVLQELKRRKVKSKVLMVSRLTSAGAQITTDALLQGAFDFILKPAGKDPAANKATLVGALKEKLSAVRDASEAPSEPFRMKFKKGDGAGRKLAGCEAVVIGCSTGGPDALSHILPFLKPDFPVPILVVQHMPEGFTASLARRMDEASELEVVEAADGLRLKKGQVVIARGGAHMRLVRRGSEVAVELSDAAHEHNCRPAVDFTLRSAVDVYGGKLLTVILTGMGRDGTEGCRLVREHGGEVIVQDADGCAVFGMPKSVINAGQADGVVPLQEMPGAIATAVRG